MKRRNPMVSPGDPLSPGQWNGLVEKSNRADNDTGGDEGVSNGAFRGKQPPKIPKVYMVRMLTDAVPDAYGEAPNVNLSEQPNAEKQIWDDLTNAFAGSGSQVTVSAIYGPLKAGDLVPVWFTGGRLVPLRQPETETLNVIGSNPSSGAISAVDTSNPPQVTTTGNHGLLTGQPVAVSGTGTVDGNWQVLSTPTPSTLTVNAPKASQPATGGTVQPIALDATISAFDGDTLTWTDGAPAWALPSNPTGLSSGRYPGRLTTYVGGRPVYTLAGVAPTSPTGTQGCLFRTGFPGTWQGATTAGAGASWSSTPDYNVGGYSLGTGPTGNASGTILPPFFERGQQFYRDAVATITFDPSRPPPAGTRITCTLGLWTAGPFYSVIGSGTVVYENAGVFDAQVPMSLSLSGFVAESLLLHVGDPVGGYFLNVLPTASSVWFQATLALRKPG